MKAGEQFHTDERRSAELGVLSTDRETKEAFNGCSKTCWRAEVVSSPKAPHCYNYKRFMIKEKREFVEYSAQSEASSQNKKIKKKKRPRRGCRRRDETLQKFIQMAGRIRVRESLLWPRRVHWDKWVSVGSLDVWTSCSLCCILSATCSLFSIRLGPAGVHAAVEVWGNLYQLNVFPEYLGTANLNVSSAKRLKHDTNMALSGS